MHIKNARPVFVPAPYCAEIEKLSKAALMDMAWDMAKQLTPPGDDGREAPDGDVLGTFRHIADVVMNYRKLA